MATGPTINSYDLRDTMLEVTAEVQETFREIEQEILGPKIMEAVLEAWAKTSDEMKEKFKADKPEAYAALMEMLK